MSILKNKALHELKSVSGWKLGFGIFFGVFLCLFILGKGPKGSYRTYLQAGQDVAAHAIPYSFTDFESGFKYSPLFALFFYPFSFFPFKAGGALWQFLNFSVFSSGLFLSMAHYFEKDGELGRILDRPYKLIILLGMVSNELMGALLHGQVNPMICGLMLLGLVFYSQDRFVLAGILLALACNFKLFPLVLALLLLWDFNWKYWITFGAAFLGFFILPAAALGWEWNWELLQTWLKVLSMDTVVERSLSLLQLLRIHVDFQRDTFYYLFVAGNVLYLCAGYRFFYSLEKKRGAATLFSLAALFIMLFNHRSENVLFVFACPVFAFLYLKLLGKQRGGQSAAQETLVLVFSYFCISLAYSDLVPPWVTHHFTELHMRTVGALLLYCYFLKESAKTLPITKTNNKNYY